MEKNTSDMPSRTLGSLPRYCGAFTDTAEQPIQGELPPARGQYLDAFEATRRLALELDRAWGGSPEVQTRLAAKPIPELTRGDLRQLRGILEAACEVLTEAIADLDDPRPKSRRIVALSDFVGGAR